MGFKFKGFNPLLGYWRTMCERPTAAEAALEPAIAKLGERYRHQYPFWGLKYFADFALLDRKLIIEVDGASHDNPRQKEKDLQHALQVLELGWRIVRLTNEAALDDADEAVQFALAAANASKLVFPDKVSEAQAIQAQLDRLHQDYPYLLAESAKQSKRRSQSAIKAARTRRLKNQKAEKVAPTSSRSKRSTPAPAPA